MELAEDASYNGGLPLIYEWPRYCTYWKLPEVQEFIKTEELQLANLDGCNFGLRSCIPGSEWKYLMKPWTMATNLPEVHARLNGRLCSGTGPNHVHDTTCGKNARHSQGYTTELVQEIHYGIRDYFMGPNCWWHPLSSTQASSGEA